MNVPPQALRPVRDLLRCPVCRGHVLDIADAMQCAELACRAVFPIVQGVPVLLNEKHSVFSVSDFVGGQDTYFRSSPEGAVMSTARRFIPRGSANISARANYLRLEGLLMAGTTQPTVLVVGAGTVGDGMDRLLANQRLRVVETDVAINVRTAIVCDAHDIPFADESFDAVVAQAVLEHVVNPSRCVEEIRRVLKPDGIVYAETPFMQQVHAGKFDFTRFTRLGHRRLFREFRELDSGIACGPGMALSWAYRYFLMSFTTSASGRRIAGAFAEVTSFYLKYFDRFLSQNESALDAASGFYFLGRKSSVELSDRDLVNLYRGGIR